MGAIWKIFTIAAALSSAVPATARLTETAKVRYDTNQGSSGWQQTDVSFLTGSELNELTGTFRFSSFKSYAAIFFGTDASGQAEIAVIRIDSPLLICGTKFEASCLPLAGEMSGPDQEGRTWEICTGSFCL